MFLVYKPKKRGMEGKKQGKEWRKKQGGKEEGREGDVARKGREGEGGEV